MLLRLSKCLIFLIALLAFMNLQSCVSSKKYNHLQHEYQVLHAQKHNEKDNYEMQLNKKEVQIQELLKHIKELETYVKKLKSE